MSKQSTLRESLINVLAQAEKQGLRVRVDLRFDPDDSGKDDALVVGVPCMLRAGKFELRRGGEVSCTYSVLGVPDPFTPTAVGVTVVDLPRETMQSTEDAGLRLLARIHRDGGHRLTAVGHDQAFAEAEQVLDDLFDARRKYDALGAEHDALHYKCDELIRQLAATGRWEAGFRNIVNLVVGPHAPFEIDDVVEKTRDLAGCDQNGDPIPGRLGPRDLKKVCRLLDAWLLCDTSDDDTWQPLARMTRNWLAAVDPKTYDYGGDPLDDVPSPLEAETHIAVDGTEHDRLVCFFYLLTRGVPGVEGMPWGVVKQIVREVPSSARCIYTSKAGEALAVEIVTELLDGTKPEGERLIDEQDERTAAGEEARKEEPPG